MEQQKVYLKTIEEVSDALAAGETIYNKYKTKIWKDKNGFIVSETEGGSKFLNDYMFTQDDEPYILEPKPIEVKLWHLYEDNFGREIFIYYKCDLGEHPFIGLVRENKDIEYISHNGEIWLDTNQKVFLVKELADLSKYFEKEKKDGENS